MKLMIAGVMLNLVASSPADSEACPAHPSAGVDQRGDAAMGFSHQKTAHHFKLTADGGTIFAEALTAEDVRTRDSIRGHMVHIAQAFAAGDFAMPMFIHDQTPPGIPVMKRLRARIRYTAEDTERGGQVRIRTTDPEAVDAIHAFLTFQITDHRTGDATSVQQ